MPKSPSHGDVPQSPKPRRRAEEPEATAATGPHNPLDRVVVMSPRPGTITEIVDIGLPAERDYTATLASSEFRAATGRVRELLGAVSAHE